MDFNPNALGAHEQAFQNAESGDFWDPPAGNYQAQCTGVEWKKTKAGDQMLMIKLLVLSGQFAGQTWTQNTVFKESVSPTKLGIMKSNLLALGIDANRTGLRGLNPDVLAGAKGQVASAKVEHNVHQGNTYINTYLTGGGTPNAPQQQSPQQQQQPYQQQAPQQTQQPYQQQQQQPAPQGDGFGGGFDTGSENLPF